MDRQRRAEHELRGGHVDELIEADGDGARAHRRDAAQRRWDAIVGATFFDARRSRCAGPAVRAIAVLGAGDRRLRAQVQVRDARHETETDARADHSSTAPIAYG